MKHSNYMFDEFTQEKEKRKKERKGKQSRCRDLQNYAMQSKFEIFMILTTFCPDEHFNHL
jgi:hypothetical protein